MSSVHQKPSPKTILIPTEKRKKITQSVSNDQGKFSSEERISSDRRMDAQNRVEQHKHSLISPEVRSVAFTPAKITGNQPKQKSFAKVALEMINYLSKEEPDLFGWAEDYQHFYVNNHKDMDRVCKAMKPFFDHGNFSSFRRQLSAYNFTRISGGRYQGYWYHPRFHQLSNEDDIRDIQSSRRRRGQGSSSSKSTKPTEPAHSIKSRKSAEVQRGLIELPEQECAHMLVLDSMASLFPLASLAKDAILTGGFVESEKDATPNSILDSQRGLGMGSTESHPLSGVLSCTPIKPNNFAVPFLRSAFSPHMGAVTGLIDYYEGFDDNKENLTGVADQVNPYQLAFDQYSPTTPVNQLSMCRRSSPFAYDCRLTQLLCSPNRQRPGDNLAENRKPILFSFHGDLPVAGLASLNALQPKKPPAHQCDANCESESNSKPAAVKRIS